MLKHNTIYCCLLSLSFPLYERPRRWKAELSSGLFCNMPCNWSWICLSIFATQAVSVILDFTHNEDIAGVNLKRDGQETSTLVSRVNLKAEEKKDINSFMFQRHVCRVNVKLVWPKLRAVDITNSSAWEWSFTNIKKQGFIIWMNEFQVWVKEYYGHPYQMPHWHLAGQV